MKLIDLNVADFAIKLASSEPTPGGGSAAALSGVMGTALLRMVCNLTTGRKKYAEHEELMQEILAKTEEKCTALLAAIDADADAYDGVSAAFKMPKETDDEKKARSAAIQEALKAATLSPFAILEHCGAVLALAYKAKGCTNTNAASDLGVAAMNLKIAMDGAWLNMLINISGIKDEVFCEDLKAKAQTAINQAENQVKEIIAQVMLEIS
ncbi:MAG: cyclodeaminase/cyclohydrolase family protein [Defluviitaleaceae bacterium]|nr:cyclodeaminase/cyclohydrolase family protein [Defluviitaleaceae bacterium]